MILYVLSLIMRIEAVFLIPALVIALFHGEGSAAMGLAFSAALLIALSLPSLFLRPAVKTLYARDGFIIVGLSWLVISFFGALPFYFSGAIPSLLDCFFEAVSGFTTTGASILDHVEELPQSLIYWRSFTQWLGGMGVLVFLLAIIPMAKGTGYSMHLMRAESPGPKIGKLVPRMRRTAGILYAIYVGMTLLQVFILLLDGMPPMDAVTITFGTAGTGGFSVRNNGMADYSNFSQNVITIFMALFAVNFSIYYMLLARMFRQALRNEELRVYFGIMIVSIIMIAIDVAPMFASVGEAIHHAAFQVSSLMSSTGYATADFNLWPEFSRTLLLMLMIVGASAGSTGGGIKVARIVILWKTTRQSIHRFVHPNSIQTVHMDGEVLDEGTVRGVNMYFGLYVLVLVCSILILSLDRFPMEDSLSAVISCMNNTGPGLDSVGPIGNYGGLSHMSKFTLICDMLLGRLELLPLVALFAPSAWKG